MNDITQSELEKIYQKQMSDKLAKDLKNNESDQKNKELDQKIKDFKQKREPRVKPKPEPEDLEIKEIEQEIKVLEKFVSEKQKRVDKLKETIKTKKSTAKYQKYIDKNFHNLIHLDQQSLEHFDKFNKDFEMHQKIIDLLKSCEFKCDYVKESEPYIDDYYCSYNETEQVCINFDSETVKIRANYEKNIMISKNADHEEIDQEILINGYRFHLDKDPLQTLGDMSDQNKDKLYTSLFDGPYHKDTLNSFIYLLHNLISLFMGNLWYKYIDEWSECPSIKSYSELYEHINKKYMSPPYDEYWTEPDF
jgi:hypothetical protein